MRTFVSIPSETGEGLTLLFVTVVINYLDRSNLSIAAPELFRELNIDLASRSHIAPADNPQAHAPTAGINASASTARPSRKHLLIPSATRNATHRTALADRTSNTGDDKWTTRSTRASSSPRSAGPTR
jgi:hypothetical protein